MRPYRHKETEWHCEARRLREDGLTHREIAERVGKTAAAVAQFFCRDRNNGRSPSEPDPLGNLVEPHKRRVIRRIIAGPDAIMSAARRFAAGEIDRATLMKGIAA